MAWARALVDISSDVNDLDEDDDLIKIELKKIAERFLNYYWNHSFYFNLKQGPVKPTIVNITEELINTYIESTKSNQPIRYEKKKVHLAIENDIYRVISEIVPILKKDVSYRFLELRGENLKWMYDYQKNSDYLLIKKRYLKILKENCEILYPLINSRWAQIVESFDYSPRINKKVKFLDDKDYVRSPLKKFHTWLDKENIDHSCFICDKEILDKELSLDHVIPWSYLFEDNLWNLVYVHKKCNSTKSNMIPNKIEIEKLENRNQRLLQILDKEGFFGKVKMKGKVIAEDLKFAIENKLVRKFWTGCKG
ncbi:MAG: HNH endonuclease [Promethearchaeota archaeon]